MSQVSLVVVTEIRPLDRQTAGATLQSALEGIGLGEAIGFVDHTRGTVTEVGWDAIDQLTAQLQARGVRLVEVVERMWRRIDESMALPDTEVAAMIQAFRKSDRLVVGAAAVERAIQRSSAGIVILASDYDSRYAQQLQSVLNRTVVEIIPSNMTRQTLGPLAGVHKAGCVAIKRVGRRILL